MSLLSFIAENKGLFGQHVGRPAVRPELPNVVEKRSDPSWMGSAIDYAMRFGMRARWRDRAHVRRLLADKALARLAFRVDLEDHKRLAKMVSDAETVLQAMADEEDFGGAEARAALVLGRTEVFGRGGEKERLRFLKDNLDSLREN